jgi:hypothetical protein
VRSVLWLSVIERSHDDAVATMSDGRSETGTHYTASPNQPSSTCNCSHADRAPIRLTPQPIPNPGEPAGTDR